MKHWHGWQWQTDTSKNLRKYNSWIWLLLLVLCRILTRVRDGKHLQYSVSVLHSVLPIWVLSLDYLKWWRVCYSLNWTFLSHSLEFEFNFFFFLMLLEKESVILIFVGMLVPAVWLIWKICIWCLVLKVHCETVTDGEQTIEPWKFTVSYDKLVIALGSHPSTFGIQGVNEHAIFLREVHHAQEIRRKLLLNLMLSDVPGLLQYAMFG